MRYGLEINDSVKAHVIQNSNNIFTALPMYFAVRKEINVKIIQFAVILCV